MQTNSRFLATAHSLLMFLALAALAGLAYTWAAPGPQATLERLANAALCLQTAVLLYLASTAVVELNIVQSLRTGVALGPLLSLPTFLGHLWVLLVGAITVWRQASSRALIAGQDWQLAALLATSFVALVLFIPTHQTAAARSSAALEARAERQSRALSWLHLCISVGVILALWYLESRPLELRE